MKTSHLVVFGLFIATATVRAQSTINAGDAFYYGFNGLPRVQTAVPGGGQFGQVSLVFEPSSMDPLDSFTLEMFETDATGASMASVHGTGTSSYLSCSAGGWQDLQGGMRLTIQSGSVTLNTIDFVVVTTAAPGLINVYQATFVPVPEPSTTLLLGVGAAALCLWRVQRKVNANPG
jgi:hypothetical protein